MPKSGQRSPTDIYGRVPARAAEEYGPVVLYVVGRKTADGSRGGSDGSAGPRREGRSAVGGEGLVSQEHVPGRRFYVIFAVLLATALLLGFYVASRSRWGGAQSTVWIWLLAAVAAGLVAPDLAQYALLRRFGARPRRVNCSNAVTARRSPGGGRRTTPSRRRNSSSPTACQP